MKPRVGTKLSSATDATTVVVVRWSGAEAEVTCGGAPMVDPGVGALAPVAFDPARQDGTQLGKRYTDEDRGIELLCTKAGTGTLAADGVAMALKDAKALPASD